MASEDDKNWAEDDARQTIEQIKDIEQIVPGYFGFDSYVKDAFEAMRMGIKTANNLPSGSNYNYYNCFPSFSRAKDTVTSKILNSMQKIIKAAGVPGQIHRREINEKFDLLQEANDVFLDRAGMCMDLESGIGKNPIVELVVSQTKPKAASWNVMPLANAPKLDENASQSIRLIGGKNVQRPQIFFKDKIDNSPKPWEPRIKEKPNSLKPLAIYLEEGENGEFFNHPYEVELDKFEPHSDQLNKREPAKYNSIDETPLIMVETPNDLKRLLGDLKEYNEIAIDLEHHSYRSFQGITCLMQISTKHKDYIIDTLSLRSELHELNEIFTKPTVLKVFHGAESDIQWLQRDLSLYIVNMFDTHQAAKQLNFPYLSLSYLLKRYCDIDPNKRFQLADWRIRPLPDDFKKYAREDTHYLLYIKDILINDLIDSANGKSNILKAVYDRSTQLCKQTYIKPVWTEESYMNIYRKSQKMFNNKQLYALGEIHRWRDTVAREEDDSTGYVLPNHMLLNIAETLPREMQGILACCNPIPPLVRQNLLNLHKIILTARNQPLIKPVVPVEITQPMARTNEAINSEAWSYLPHDIPNGAEARVNLPCLLDDNAKDNPVMESATPKISIFDSPPTSEDEGSNTEAFEKPIFISPFQRYKLVLPMVAEEEAKKREDDRKLEEERLAKLSKDKEETARSVNRVYEHFKQVTEIIPEKGKCKKPNQTPLGQMPGKKRKREANVEDDSDSDVILVNDSAKEGKEFPPKKKGKDKMQKFDHFNDRPTIIRSRAKGDKKKISKQLEQNSMLPSKKFDYQAVNFESFQGGSMQKPSQNIKFQQPTKKEKRRRQKKQKFNI